MSEVYSVRDSYGSRIAFEFTPDDGNHPSCLQISIVNPDGSRETNVQFLGGDGTARILDAMKAFAQAVQS